MPWISKSTPAGVVTAKSIGTNNTLRVYARRQRLDAGLVRACAARRRTTLEASPARGVAKR
jgi:hypothetical protein